MNKPMKREKKNPPNQNPQNMEVEVIHFWGTLWPSKNLYKVYIWDMTWNYLGIILGHFYLQYNSMRNSWILICSLKTAGLNIGPIDNLSQFDPTPSCFAQSNPNLGVVLNKTAQKVGSNKEKLMESHITAGGLFNVSVQKVGSLGCRSRWHLDTVAVGWEEFVYSHVTMPHIQTV